MKRFLSLLLVIVLSITMLAGCRKNKTDVDTDDEGEKVVSKVKDEERILRLDGDNLGYPSVYTVSPKGRGYLLTSFIFDTLTWKDENGIVPMLAKEWRVSEDNKVWTFTLAQNAKFTDGEPVTAEDVKFSFEYIQGHPYQWVSLNMVEKVEAVDAHTVKVTLKDVHAPFITDVAGNVPIMPKHIWEDIKEPEKFNTKEAVIGSGPLMLEKYQEDTGVYVFVANKDYFLGEPVIDRLILSPNNNSKEALEKGEIDGAQQIKYGEAMQIKKDGKFNVIEGPGFWVARLYLNYNEPVFGVKEFRQAMYYAINREELVEKATKNSGVPGNPGHIHPDSEWYYGGIKEYEYDPTKANELLDKANITDSNGDGIREFKGKQLKFELLTTEDRVDDAEMIKAYLGTIGIGLEIKSLDSINLITESLSPPPPVTALITIIMGTAITPPIELNRYIGVLKSIVISFLARAKYGFVCTVESLIDNFLPVLPLDAETSMFPINPSKKRPSDKSIITIKPNTPTPTNIDR